MPMIRPAQSVHSRVFEGELVILDLAGGKYYALDSIGARLWGALAKGRPIEEVADEVASEYDVAPARAMADLRTLAADLLARGLLVEDDA